MTPLKKIDSMLRLANVNGTKIQLNSSVTSSKPKVLLWPKTKSKPIWDWPEPRKIKDIQSFLGFTNFYYSFIFNYSDITVPLTWLTHKGTPWAWTEDCQSLLTTSNYHLPRHLS